MRTFSFDLYFVKAVGANLQFGSSLAYLSAQELAFWGYWLGNCRITRDENVEWDGWSFLGHFQIAFQQLSRKVWDFPIFAESMLCLGSEASIKTVGALNPLSGVQKTRSRSRMHVLFFFSYPWSKLWELLHMDLKKVFCSTLLLRLGMIKIRTIIATTIILSLHSLWGNPYELPKDEILFLLLNQEWRCLNCILITCSEELLINKW